MMQLAVTAGPLMGFGGAGAALSTRKVGLGNPSLSLRALYSVGSPSTCCTKTLYQREITVLVHKTGLSRGTVEALASNVEH